MITPDGLGDGTWWEEPLTLVDGCTHVSEGCRHCWSEVISKRFKRDWTPRFRADRLAIPLRAKKPRVYAVWNDLFHPVVSFQEISATFKTMAAAERHGFMVLTKRPERLAEWREYAPEGHAWSNVALGVTVESQKHVGRVGQLLKAWPGLTFVSVEPCLGPVNLLPYIGANTYECQCGWHETEMGLFPRGQNCYCAQCSSYATRRNGLGYVITGGESGPKARPMHPDWARSLRDQCAQAGVPFLFKQWGEWREAAPDIEWQGENPSNYRFAEVNGTRMVRVGRKRAGRVLDGVLHDGWFGKDGGK